MKPDIKYMSTNNNDNFFETFDVSLPLLNLNSFCAPIINMDNLRDSNSNFPEKNSYFLGSQMDLRGETLKKVLGGESELYSYNKVSNSVIDNIFESPTPTDVLRNFDMDLNEDDLLLDDFERSKKSNSTDSIFEKIKKNNPMLFETLASYKIPFPISKVLVKRIITLTNDYNDRK